MDALLIGLDGGDQSILEAFDMPFVKRLIDRGISYPMNESLLSRGWAEMLTGMDASENGGLYMTPELDGTPTFMQKYGLTEMTRNPAVRPLWEMLRSRNKSIGMMNVPTTRPAREIDGFVVSGGGGGVGKIDGIPEDYIYPKDIGPQLQENQYVFDLRIHTSGIRDFFELLDRFDDIVKTRASSYVALAKRFSPDFGFLCFRVTTGLQYLARSEIEAIQKEGAPKNDIGARIWRHYQVLDDAIKTVFEAVNPNRYLIAGDHGTAPHLFSVNPDAFLMEHGWLAKNRASASIIKGILRQVKGWIPYSIRSNLRKKAAKTIHTTLGRFDIANTNAFGVFRVPGIYINDTPRFGGPVAADHIDDLVDAICAAFNGDERCRKHTMRAIPYRRNFANTFYYDGLPDIRIVAPDTMLFTTVGGFIEQNESYGPISVLLSNLRTGLFGCHPICCVDKETASFREEDDPDDLRLVYRFIERMYPDETRSAPK